MTKRFAARVPPLGDDAQGHVRGFLLQLGDLVHLRYQPLLQLGKLVIGHEYRAIGGQLRRESAARPPHVPEDMTATT
jgi:hypothetical protein